jgi:N6-L-threonylcarbamoyladenine synthase
MWEENTMHVAYVAQNTILVPPLESPSLKVLGIESSCDETAAAIVELDGAGKGIIHSNIIRSQVSEHQEFGGVVPEIAARAHVEVLDRLIASSLDEAGASFKDLDGIAVTAGPGLIGGLLVGLVTAKAIALVHKLPLIGVNHLEGHALTVGLTENLKPPYLLLLVSGGHTQFIAVKDVAVYYRLGGTLDDALGEAFDKVAKLLGLGFPGGPAVEHHAMTGNPSRFALPRPLFGRAQPDFSFSGLKTAVREAARNAAPLSSQDVRDLCASFQAAIADTLKDRVATACQIYREHFGTGGQDRLVIAGGVAANTTLRKALTEAAQEQGFQFHVPPPALCTDNAAMIAWTGAQRLRLGLTDGLDMQARARWPLAECCGKPES